MKGAFFNRRTLIFDGILVVVFFLFISEVLRPFVPAQTELWTTVFAYLGGLCLTGVFFLGLQMFRATLTDQRQRRRARRR